MFSTSMKINNGTARKYYTTILSKDCMSLILQVKYFNVSCTSFFYYIYITPVNNLPLAATKSHRFTNIYNKQYN